MKSLALHRIVPSYLIAAIVVSIAGSLVADDVLAASPKIQFDTSSVVACLDVTTPEFQARYPDERLIEARFMISSLVASGDHDDVIQYLYQIHGPTRSFEIVDFTPNTEMTSSFAGNISVEEGKERNANLGINASGTYDFLVSTSAQAGMGTKRTDKLKYEKVPDQDVLVSSGTINHNTGVFFKLNASPRIAMEGRKEFVVLLRVPQSWRADFVHVHCSAVGLRRGVVPPLNEQQTSGRSHFTVALYQAGDLDAKRGASEFVYSRSDLIRVAYAKDQEIRKRSFPTAIDKLGSLLSLSKPRIPEDWLTHLMANGSFSAYRDHLPEDVERAATEYLTARKELMAMSR